MMDPLTGDVIVDACPAETVELAYHYGIGPAELSEGVVIELRPKNPVDTAAWTVPDWAAA